MENWYKTAKSEKKPFKAVVYSESSGQERELTDIPPVWAVSRAQAFVIFRKKYPIRYAEYEEAGMGIRMSFDEKTMQEAEERKRAQEATEQHREEMIQNAWWQD